MSKENNILQIVQQHLKMRNVAPHVIEDAPILVRRAVVRLQSRQILPPKVMEFKSINKKEEKYDINDEVEYNFYFLPDDFRTLEEFYVRDGSGDDVSNPYNFTSYSNYMFRTQGNKDTSMNPKLFTITDVNEEGENNRKILIAAPFPDDTKHIQIKYYPDGINTTSDYYTPRHWEAIIEQIEIILGIISPEQEIQTIEEVSAWKNQKGKNIINGANTRTRVSFPFSGKTSSRITTRRRRR